MMDDAFLSIVGVAALAAIDKKVTERLVKWFAFLKGDLITLASVLVGWGLAYLFSIDPTSAIAAAVGKPIMDLPIVALYLISGLAIAFSAGFLADREELRFGVTQDPGESVTAEVGPPKAPRYDEGFNPGDPGYDEWKAAGSP